MMNFQKSKASKAIVIATDNAKYDLNSTGEYTQGAGAIAMLITSNPKIIAFSKEVGVSTEGVFDFFKPRRYFTKEQITGSESNPDWLGVLENEVAIYKEQPIFDGQYSNQCYINRISDAYFHYKDPTLEGTWPNDKPHVIYGYAAIDSAKTLNIQAGTHIYMHKNAILYVYKSTLNIQGTLGNEVIIEGDRLEQDYKDVAGQFYGIYFQQARPCTIDYAIIKNGTSGVHLYDEDPTNTGYTLTMTNTIIKNQKTYVACKNTKTSRYYGEAYATAYIKGERVKTLHVLSEKTITVNCGN